MPHQNDPGAVDVRHCDYATNDPGEFICLAAEFGWAEVCDEPPDRDVGEVAFGGECVTHVLPAPLRIRKCRTVRDESVVPNDDCERSLTCRLAQERFRMISGRRRWCLRRRRPVGTMKRYDESETRSSVQAVAQDRPKINRRFRDFHFGPGWWPNAPPEPRAAVT